MKREIINPWEWQDQFGFVQGNAISESKRLLFTAGQVSVDAEGNLLHPNDMGKQIDKVVDNLEAVIHEAGFKLSDVIRFTYYTTDVARFCAESPSTLNKRLDEAKCKPATSLIGVNALFHPDCVVEIEAVVAA